MILITGATGFLGSQLAYDLSQQGVSLRCLKRSGSVIPARLKSIATIEWVEGDVNDTESLLEAMRGINKVYHCAAVVSLTSKNTARQYHVNIKGTENVVNAALDCGVQRLLHVSSIAALGLVKEGFVTEETTFEHDKKSSPYSISKYYSELEVWRGEAEGLNVVVVNPSVIIGPDPDRLGPFRSMVYLAKKGSRFYTEGSTGFVDVRDVSAIMIRLMENGKAKGRYILSAENVSFKEWFSTMSELFGKKAPRKRLAPSALRCMSYLAGLYAFFTNRRNFLPMNVVRTATEKHFYSNERVKMETDYIFAPINESIAATCRSYQ